MAAAKYAYGTFNFKLEINGLTLGHFQNVTGLGHEIEVLTHQEGGVNDRQHKLPGQGSFPNVTLKLGYVASELAEDWHFNFAINPKSVGRKDGSIVMLDDAGEELMRWNFVRAWPVKWDGPEFNSGADNLAVETLEIAHEGLNRDGARRPAAAAGVSIGASASFGASIGGSASFGAGASLGASASVQASFNASAGASFSAEAGFSAGAQAGAQVGAQAKAQAQNAAAQVKAQAQQAAASAKAQAQNAAANAKAQAGANAKVEAGFSAKVGG
ncbi:MAG: phage tail protein [Myxococcales bacterium]|nr:phage tail protein [bacterium]MCB9549538.1 phage tail protein [Myxococcales bacterium]